VLVRDPVLYLRDIVRIVSEVDPDAQVIEPPLVALRDDYLGGLLAAIRYRDLSELHLNLWADCSQDTIEWYRYSFHYQDRNQRLRFRFDNAPHHPYLPDFPRHVHSGTGEIWPGGPPSVHEIARLIERCLEGTPDSGKY
jgi:hypothetical protein